MWENVWKRAAGLWFWWITTGCCATPDEHAVRDTLRRMCCTWRRWSSDEWLAIEVRTECMMRSWDD